ncbi:MAG: hypothetical protein FWD27_04415 [Coriobacteriia bacterium]|nr:hypothetical protein [Coriobacteriia bacterium]
MKNKIKQIGKHVLYVLFSSALYGLALYLVTIWLAGYSLLWAYVGNLVLIIFALWSDEFAIKQFKSAITTKEGREALEKDRFFWFYADSFVSYKTVLYLFYVVVLIASQVAEFYPDIFSEEVASFLLANRFSILILLAYDMLTQQFSKDRTRAKALSEELKARTAESTDEK